MPSAFFSLVLTDEMHCETTKRTITNNSTSISDVCILAKIGRASNLLYKFFKMDEFKDYESFDFFTSTTVRGIGQVPRKFKNYKPELIDND